MLQRAVRNGVMRRKSHAGEFRNWKPRPRSCKSRPRLLKRTDQLEVLDLDEEPSCNHGYAVGVQCLFLRLVLAQLSQERIQGPATELELRGFSITPLQLRE
jgi:hypothetical protein